MPPIEGGAGLQPRLAANASQMARQENAKLLAALIKAMPDANNLQPATIKQILNDPVQLSLLIRQVGLQTEIARSFRSQEVGLKGALHKVAPQHLEALLAALDRNEQPAINLDESYGEPASLQGNGTPPDNVVAGQSVNVGHIATHSGVTLDATHFDAPAQPGDTEAEAARAFTMPPHSAETVWQISFAWPAGAVLFLVLVTISMLVWLK